MGNKVKKKTVMGKSHGKQSKTYQSPLTLARAYSVVKKANNGLDVVLEKFVSKLEVCLSSIHPVGKRISGLNSGKIIRGRERVDKEEMSYQVLS